MHFTKIILHKIILHYHTVIKTSNWLSNFLRSFVTWLLTSESNDHPKNVLSAKKGRKSCRQAACRQYRRIYYPPPCRKRINRHGRTSTRRVKRIVGVIIFAGFLVSFFPLRFNEIVTRSSLFFSLFLQSPRKRERGRHPILNQFRHVIVQKPCTVWLRKEIISAGCAYTPCTHSCVAHGRRYQFETLSPASFARLCSQSMLKHTTTTSRCLPSSFH